MLVHLVMRQKPRQLLFPAFRFLKHRLQSNRRRMRLQNLFLLALRIGVLAALCLALARPRVESSAVAWNAEQPVNAVFLFDTSPRMDYIQGGESRLKAAGRRAEALLDGMAEGSRVAVLDSSDDPDAGVDRTLSLTQARGRVKGLTTRPAAYPVSAHLGRAHRALSALAAEGDAAPRLVYVFSDRTRPSWVEGHKPDEPPQGARAFFVDVGVDEPREQGITNIEVVPPVVEPGRPLQVRITVRGTGAAYGNQVACQIDNDPDQARTPFKNRFDLGRGEQKTVTWLIPEAPALPPKTRTAAYQLTAKLETPDPLAFNDLRSATFLVPANAAAS